MTLADSSSCVHPVDFLHSASFARCIARSRVHLRSLPLPLTPSHLLPICLSLCLCYLLAISLFPSNDCINIVGKQIQFGNNVPFSKTKTRRTWLPNVQTKRLFSETLNNWIRLNMTTSVIRTVDKKGGLDRYLLETRPDLLGAKGVELRGKIVEALKAKQARKAMATFSQQQQMNTTTLSSEASQAVKAATNPTTPVINATSTTTASQATPSL